MICDVTDEEQVRKAVVVAAEPLGGLHIAVANAGGGVGGLLVETTLGAWNSVLALNLTGAFLTIKHAAAAMQSAGGSIVPSRR